MAKKAHGDIERHRKHLAKASPKRIKRDAQLFRIEEDAFHAALPIACVSAEISVTSKKWREWAHPLEPASLDDLKNWFGTPNVAAEQQLSMAPLSATAPAQSTRIAHVDKRHLPTKSFQLQELEPEQVTAVRQLSTNLLFGYVPRDDLADRSVSVVVDHMLERAVQIEPHVFVGSDLVVCPDDKVVFDQLPALYFNNVLIYGNGEIQTKSHTKLQAQQIQHVD